MDEAVHSNFVIYSKIYKAKSLVVSNESLIAYYLIKDKFFGDTKSPNIVLEVYLLTDVSEVQDL